MNSFMFKALCAVYLYESKYNIEKLHQKSLKEFGVEIKEFDNLIDKKLIEIYFLNKQEWYVLSHKGVRLISGIIKTIDALL